MGMTYSATGPDVPVSGPMVWRGADLAQSGDWDHTLTGDMVAELDRAIADIRSRAIAVPDIKRDDVPLPVLAPLLMRVRDDVVDGRGVAMLRGLPVDRWSREDAAIAYFGIGAHIGVAVSQNPQGHVLGHVKDVGADADDVNSRGYRSHASLPFHTDIGAEAVGLFCLKPSRSGGLSSVVSASAIHNEMLRLRPDLVAALAGPWFHDRRGEVLDGMLPYYTMPVFNYRNDRLYVCYVRRFIESAQRFDAVPQLTPLQTEALNLLSNLAESPELRLDMAFGPGDIQFVNNLSTLHSRTEYEDYDDPDRKRHLLRLWLTIPGGKPLPQGYYDRYGTVTAAGRPMGVNAADGTRSAPLDVPEVSPLA